MEQAFQQMTEQMQQLLARQATLEGQLAHAQAQAQQAQAQTVVAGAHPSHNTGVDLRLLGKPSDFNGDADKWKEWCTIFRGYAAAALPRIEAHMEHVIGQDTPATNATLDPDVSSMSKQLYWMLLMLLKGNAHTMLLNAGNGEGLVAWQVLHQHFEPRLKTRFAAQLMNLMAYNFAGDVIERMTSWEREVGIYESASGKKLDDEARIGIILLRLPDSPLKTHLLMRVDTLQAWADFRQEILSISRAMATSSRMATPMEIGAIAKGKNKGKDDQKAGGGK
eukprot:2359761-Amphidinium_carterae.1